MPAAGGRCYPQLMRESVRLDYELLKLAIATTEGEGHPTSATILCSTFRTFLPDLRFEAIIDACTRLCPEFVRLRKYEVHNMGFRDYSPERDNIGFFSQEFRLKRTSHSRPKFEELRISLEQDGAAARLVPPCNVERIAARYEIGELARQCERIRNAVISDTEQAVGSAKELLETTFKTIIGDHAQKSTDDIPTLLKKAQKALNLDPVTVSSNATLKRTLSNLGQVAIGVAEIRSLYGAGHGRSKGAQLGVIPARLIANAALSLATFFLETWEAGLN